MFSVEGIQKNTCTLLAVLCGDVEGFKNRQKALEEDKRLRYPFPELCSSGRLEVQIVTNPTVDEFQQVVESLKPDIVYLQGEQLESEQIGSLVWDGVIYSTSEKICGLFGSTLPRTVYLEVPNGEPLAEALHLKGVSYVLHWTKNALSCYEACHFRHSFLSVIQSSCSHAWDAFQLARASYMLYCVRNNHVLTVNTQGICGILGPQLLGDPPTTTIYATEEYVDEEDEKFFSGAESSIEVYDDDVNMKVLLCGVPCTLDGCLLGSLEDGIKAILNIEIRGSKLRSRISAPPPPLQAGAFSHGVVTMRCDVSTSTCSYISLLVSGSAQTCFDDELLENQIKNELLEKSHKIQAFATSDDMYKSFSAPRTSVSIACGAPIYEVCVKVPAWAAQVLKQLASETSYRTFVAMGVATIQGSSVASFDKDDSERLLFFGTREMKNLHLQNAILNGPPSWLRPPTPSQKRLLYRSDVRPDLLSVVHERKSPVTEACESNGREIGALEFSDLSVVPVRKKVKVAALRPIPRVHYHGLLPFQMTHKVDGYYGDQGKTNLPSAPVPKYKHVGSAPVSMKKPLSSSNNAREFVRLNPLPLKKHGCDRSPVQVCSEEEFLNDLMHFLIMRGHSRLVPQGGLTQFPDAILNGKRLDLYNLYREVVSRGGFHVGNGINWKGQVFSRMRNHTVTNKMTGVGNALKKHYETYLLDYELAHDDVDGECCLLCQSSAAGDWVNCGLCGEWAHFGCDRRQGLGAFKEYAKKDGLDYICPHCSLTNFSRRPQNFRNEYLRTSIRLPAL